MLRINKLIGAIFFVALAFVSSIKLIGTFRLFSNYVGVIIGSVVIFICVLLFCFIFFKTNILQDKIAPKLNFINYCSSVKLIGVLILISLITKVIAVFILKIDSINSENDIKTYVISSAELSKWGEVRTYSQYVLDFSHLFWFAVSLLPVVSIFGVSQTAVSIYLSIVATLSVILIFDTLSYKISKKVSFIISLILLILPSQIIVPQIITHEIVLIFFISISMWLYFKAIPKSKSLKIRVVLFLLFTFDLLLCTLINGQGIVVCIAYILCILISKKNKLKEWFLSFGKISLIMIFIIFGSIFANMIHLNMVNLASNNNPNNPLQNVNKMYWTLYVGSNFDEAASYSVKDAQKFSQYSQIYSKDQINNYQKDLLLERWRSLASEPGKVVHLIYVKVNTIWRDFSYPYLVMQNSPLTDGYENSDVINNMSVLLHILENVFYLFVSFIGLISSFVNLKKTSIDYMLFLKLLLMGVTCLLLITECNNKYSITLQPFYFIICLSQVSVDGELCFETVKRKLKK